jgi:hypothetical protein
MSNSSEEIIVEFINIGKFVKVTAVCVKTGREVSIVGDPKASKGELQALAVKKLHYVINNSKDADAAASKRGITV